MNDSFYSQFGDTGAVIPEPKPDKKVETPHANRHDLSKPYSSQFQKKCDNAPTESAPTGNGSHEFWRFFTRQLTNNLIAQQVNTNFDRRNLNGENFQFEKERYIKLYNQLIEVN